MKNFNPKQEETLSKTWMADSKTWMTKGWSGAFLYANNWTDRQESSVNFFLEVSLFAKDKNDASSYTNQIHLKITNIHRDYLKDYSYDDKENKWYTHSYDEDQVALTDVFIKVNGKEYQLYVSHEDKKQFFGEGSLEIINQISPMDSDPYGSFLWIDSLESIKKDQYIEIIWKISHVSKSDSSTYPEEGSCKYLISREDITYLKEIFNSGWYK